MPEEEPSFDEHINMLIMERYSAERPSYRNLDWVLGSAMQRNHIVAGEKVLASFNIMSASYYPAEHVAHRYYLALKAAKRKAVDCDSLENYGDLKEVDTANLEHSGRNPSYSLDFTGTLHLIRDTDLWRLMAAVVSTPRNPIGAVLRISPSVFMPNDMYVFRFKQDHPGQRPDFYAIDTQGSKWSFHCD